MRHTLKLAAFAAAALAASPAHGEEEIVVTATRSATPLADVPVRIDVIDRAEIEQRALATLAEAIGANAVQGGGAGQQSSLFLRGANSKHALALLDGIRLNDASNPTAAYDFGQDTLGGVERVEVLRGPASTIYGSDAIGGVVNVIPRRGGEEAFAPFMELAAGSFETVRGLAGAHGTAGDVAYGVSGEFFRTDGFDATPARFALHTGDADGARISTFTASARREAGAFGFDGLLRVREAEAEYDTFSGGAFFSQRADDPDLNNESSQSVWRVGADVDASDALNVRLSGGQVRSDRTETDDGFQTNGAESERSFAELVAGYAAGPARLTAGVSYERNDIDTLPQFADPLSIAEDQLSGYAMGSYDLSDLITLTGSLRLDDYEQFGSQTTYGAGAVVNLAALRVFASYATAFKAPSLSERLETSFFNVGNPGLKAEESRSWEVGADWALSGALKLSASYYQTRVDDLINYDFGALRNINVDEAEIDGAEAFVTATPADWLTLRLGYAWTDARDAATGERLLRRPEHTANFEARVTPTDRLTLVLDWSYVGERTDVTYDNAGDFISSGGVVESYTIGALAATFALDPRAEVFVRIENLTDEEYEQPNAYAGAPRTGLIGVRAAY